MFTNEQRQEERTGRYGTPRLQYLQELVSQFQSSTDEGHVVWAFQWGFTNGIRVYPNKKCGTLAVPSTTNRLDEDVENLRAGDCDTPYDKENETKEKIGANLANFAYDPYNYKFLRQLNVLELFLDCISEPNEKLVEFGAGGICNSCADPLNAEIVTQCGGIPLIVQCLSSPVRNTVNYALGSLYYLCNASNREEILKPEVIDLIRRYADAEAVSVSFSNLAKAFLDKHVRTSET